MMVACTFFGHRDCPESIKPKLRKVLVDIITNHGVDMFYVGHQGQFDAYVHSELKETPQNVSSRRAASPSALSIPDADSLRQISE